VVAEREHVCACREQAFREPRGQARSVGRVLGVDDAEPGPELVFQSRETLLERRPTGCPEDIRDEENLQRRGSRGELF
jgi:hypothetical protein